VVVFRLIAGRIAMSVVTLLLLSLLIFILIDILPRDVATRILGRQATPQNLELFRQRFHLGDPGFERYLRWLGGIVQGDFGTTLTNARPIGAILVPRLVNTAWLSLVALLLYLPLTLIPSALQAVNRDRPVDHAISVVTLTFLSIPDFLLATFLMIGFVVLVPLLPATSVVEPTSGFWEYARALVLPATTLALVMASTAIRMLRDNLIEVLDSDYVRMAEYKGLSKRLVLLRHALPNALIPSLNVTALNFTYLIGGVVIIERVFAYPGFGSLLVDALQLRDVPLIEATVLIAGAVYVTANLLADLGAILLNPKLQTASR
jgi:peptide/nickel transport system permease protein